MNSGSCSQMTTSCKCLNQQNIELEIRFAISFVNKVILTMLDFVASVYLGPYSNFHHCLKTTSVKQCFPVMALVVSNFRNC